MPVQWKPHFEPQRITGTESCRFGPQPYAFIPERLNTGYGRIEFKTDFTGIARPTHQYRLSPAAVIHKMVVLQINYGIVEECETDFG